jgi:NAD(P)H-nitrite reductase large subunit
LEDIVFCSKERGLFDLNDDVIVCRCEEVTVLDVKRAIAEGTFDIAGVKRRTRAGMGICQGRTCEDLIRQILVSELGIEPHAVPPDKVRAPLSPVTFEVLAGGIHE